MIDLNHINGQPKPFQTNGIEFLNGCNGRAFLADDPGLGKTFQLLGYTSMYNFRNLIVCPSYLKYNWENEIEKFTSKSVFVIESNKPIPDLKGFDYVIVNYDIFHKPNILNNLINANFDVITCDESQYIKNLDSKRTKAIFKVSENIPRRICLSGTPIKSKPEEFYPQLNFLHPEIEDFNDFKLFKIKYCNSAKVTLKDPTVNDNNCLLELHQKIKPFYLRRTKDQVLKELPSKNCIPVPIKLENRSWYDSLMKKKKKYGEVLKMITESKMKLSIEKLKQVIEHIDNLNKSGQKVIVFSQYTHTIKYLQNHYKDSCVIHRGEMSAQEKQNSIDKFQNNHNVNKLIANTFTAVGYNATTANNVVYVDLPWTTADIIQSSDRVHRIGQDKQVNVYFFYYKDTIEEQIFNLLNSKQQIFDQVVDGKFSKEQELSIRKEIFDNLKIAS